MAMANQYMKYKAQSVSASTPGEQVVMLFQHASMKLLKAIKCIEAGDLAEAHSAIIRVQDIYQFLSDSLDMQYEISKNLYALYQYAYDELVTANINKDAAALSRVLKTTREFQETWEQAELKTRMGRAAVR